MTPRSHAVLDSLSRNVGKLMLSTVCGLVLAGMTHIGAVLLLPWLAENDAFSRLRPTATADFAVLVAAAREERFGPPAVAPLTAGSNAQNSLPLHDPAMAVGACAYDLSDGPLRVSAPDGPLYQAISLHGRGAGAYWAITDRAAVRGRIEVVVATQAQLAELAARDEGPIDGFGDLRVVAPGREGFVLLRALAGFPSEAALATRLVEAVSCTIEPL